MRIIERRWSRQISTAVWRRYRVSQARELRHQLRSMPAIAGVLFLVSGVTLAVRYPDAAIGLMVVTGLAATFLLTFRPLARLLSPRGVLGLSFLMPATAGATVAGLIAIEPSTFATAMASMALTPIGAPLLLGWDARTNRWVEVVYGLVSVLLPC